MPIGDFLEILSQGILVGIIHLSREIGRARQALRPRPKQLDWREEYTNIYIYIYIYTHNIIYIYIYIYIYI